MLISIMKLLDMHVVQQAKYSSVVRGHIFKQCMNRRMYHWQAVQINVKQSNVNSQLQLQTIFHYILFTQDQWHSN